VFLFDEKYAREFELFGWLHLLIVVLAAGSLVGMYYLRERLKIPMAGRIFRITVAALLFAGEIAFHLWTASWGEFRWANAIPLGLCDLMNWVTMVALLFDLKGVVRVVLPWAFAGALLSFAVVDMGRGYGFPHFRFFHYFANHWLFLVGCLYYLFTERFSYTYRDLLRSSAVLGGWALVVLAVDLVFDRNDMFLVEWPHELDVVNQLLVFPLNTMLLAAGIFALFNLFYLIFVLGRFDRQPGGAAGARLPSTAVGS
jgi:hypothetical integral membrane protein (TIGR02206 family)